MNLLIELSNDELDVEVISEAEYLQLDEGAQRAFRRVGNNISQYYRCTSGPKKGKLASDPSKCGQRKDPAKVRHGRRVAQKKGAVRVRKTIAKKKTTISKRVSKLNQTIRNRNTGRAPTRESFLDYIDTDVLLENVTILESQEERLINQLDSAIDLVENININLINSILVESDMNIQIHAIDHIDFNLIEDTTTLALQLKVSPLRSTESTIINLTKSSSTWVAAL